MKNKTIGILLFVYLAQPPTFAQQVMSTAGAVAESDDGITLSWTLGESITSTYAAYGNLLTQGFQQPYFSFSQLVEDTKSTISIYPNPTSDQLMIRGSGDSQPEIEIINTIGQVVYRTEYSDLIDVSALARGFYYVKIYAPYYLTLKFEKL